MTIEFDLKVCVGCGVEVCLVWFGTGLAGCCHSSSRGTGEGGMDQEGRMDGWMDAWESASVQKEASSPRGKNELAACV